MSSSRKERSTAAAQLGRRGGLKGGKARAAAMTPEERSASARRAALARHHGAEADLGHTNFERSDAAGDDVYRVAFCRPVRTPEGYRFDDMVARIPRALNAVKYTIVVQSAPDDYHYHVDAHLPDGSIQAFPMKFEPTIPGRLE